jgi:hypothetical protein
LFAKTQQANLARPSHSPPSDIALSTLRPRYARPSLRKRDIGIYRTLFTPADPPTPARTSCGDSAGVRIPGSQLNAAVYKDADFAEDRRSETRPSTVRGFIPTMSAATHNSFNDVLKFQSWKQDIFELLQVLTSALGNLVRGISAACQLLSSSILEPPWRPVNRSPNSPASGRFFPLVEKVGQCGDSH